MKTLIGTVQIGGEEVRVYRTRYTDGSLAVIAESDAGPYATLSVFVEGTQSRVIAVTNPTKTSLGAGEFVVSHNLTREARKAFRPLFDDTIKRAAYGYVRGAPVWRIKEPADE